MKAREKFISSNLKLVLSVIKKYLRSNEDINDIFEYGVEGLIKAIEKYDVNYGTTFSTYAVTSIERTIKRKSNQLIALPDYLKGTYNKYLNLINNYSNDLSDEDIMDIFDINMNTLSNIRMYEKSGVVSIDTPINKSDDKDINLGDKLSGKDNQYDNSISKIDLDILLYKLKKENL